MRKLMPMTEIVPILTEVISEGGNFRLYIKGTSMMPLLRQGTDSVILCSPYDLKKNDIILYKRSNGAYVLHRIIKIKDNEFYICGDNQFLLERGITKDCVIAKVVSIYRENDEVKLTNKKYIKYVNSLWKRRFKKRIRYYLSAIKRRIPKRSVDL